MKGIKFAIGFAFVLTAASLVGTWYIYERYDSERILREELQAENDELKEENNLLNSQLSQIKRNEDELNRLKNQVKEYISQRDSFKKQLDKAESELIELRKKVQDLASEKSKLAIQVNRNYVAERRASQEAKEVSHITPAAIPVFVQDPKKETQEVEEAVENIEKEKKEGKEKRPQEDQTKVEEKKKEDTAKAVHAAVPAAQPTSPSPKEAEARRPDQILSVNRQFNFVVVNVGLRDRLKVGDMLRVEENGKLIGRVQVEKLYENFSACKIVEELTPAKIKEGDLVRVA